MKSVNPNNAMAFTSPVIKEGPLKFYDRQKKCWKNCFGRLRQCGWLHWFEKDKSSKPIHGVDLKVVSAYFAYGELLWNLPQKPLETSECDLLRMFAVPLEPTWDTDFYFFSCFNDADMCSWISSIFNLFGQQPPERYRVAQPAMAYPPVPEDMRLFAHCNFPSMIPPSHPGTPTAMPLQRAPSPLPVSPQLSRRQSGMISPQHPSMQQQQQPSPGHLGNVQSALVYRVLPATPNGTSGQPVAMLAYPLASTPILLTGSVPFLQTHDNGNPPERGPQKLKDSADFPQSASKPPIPRNTLAEQTELLAEDKITSPRESRTAETMSFDKLNLNQNLP